MPQQGPGPHRLHEQVRRHALGLPDAWEDTPWGESVAKVGKKIFVFLGGGDGEPGMSVKLVASRDQAAAVRAAQPMGYGLGRSGWVYVALGGDGCPPLPVLCDWVEESYRLVAGKRRAALLDAVPPSELPEDRPSS